MPVNGERCYLDILERCLSGERKENRTGIDTFVLPPQWFCHDMSEGFPLMTTKKVAKKSMLVELEGFIKGITDKRWYQERGCKIWNQWSNKRTRPDDVSQEDWYDLGPIYGWMWRFFGLSPFLESEGAHRSTPCIYDQLATIVDKLHTDPNDRRMVCSAWNPPHHAEMALPPCHVLFNITHINGTLNLHWHQRSCDMFLGVPFNIASYAMLLVLLCNDAGMKPGQLSSTLCDCHIYENHIDQIKEQLSREPRKLPTVEITQDEGIFNWTHKDVKWIGYNPYPQIKAEVAV